LGLVFGMEQVLDVLSPVWWDWKLREVD
jgi:hypothetical protein